MPLMTNAEAFLYDFGIYATELWAMTEAQFLEWLNAECDRERPRDMVVRCKDCKRWKDPNDGECPYHTSGDPYIDGDGEEDFFCAYGERKDDASHPFADDVMMGERKDK